MTMTPRIHITQNELNLATAAAKNFASKWRNIEPDDLQAHLWAWLCTPSVYTSLQQYRSANQYGGLYNNMLQECARYVRANALTVSATTPQYLKDAVITTKDVKTTLPFIFDEENVRAVSPAGETPNDAIYHRLISVREGYDKLGPADRRVLALRYDYGLSITDMEAHYPDVLYSALQKRISAAINLLRNNIIDMHDWS